MKKELAELIRSKRASKGLKQEDIADQLGIAIGTYSNIERGKTDITVTRLYEIANILNVSIYDFLPINIAQANIQEPSPNKELKELRDELREEIKKIVREEISKNVREYTPQKPKPKR